MSVPVEYNVIERGLDKLLHQFKDSPNYKALVETYLELHNQIQETCFEVLASRDIQQATGLSLDLIGKIVGQQRNNLSDDDYRQAIIIKIYVNNSKGTISDIQNIVKALTNSTDVQVFEIFPAAINLYISGNPLTEEQRQIVQLICSAGVRVGNTLVAGGRDPWIPSEIDNLIESGVLPEVGVDTAETNIPVEAVI